ncbi:hypothetical protein Fmac_015510 [Flemingia macrophylla]|uniref:Uncharacterized protein n=1 Tax=Flemingia macrophylla TaxID=520843 RepID=A0ABD1MEV6_9FABA
MGLGSRVSNIVAIDTVSSSSFRTRSHDKKSRENNFFSMTSHPDGQHPRDPRP